MIIKERLLQQAIGEIRFKPKLSFHRYRFDLSDKFLEKLPSWNLNWRIIELFDQKEKEKSNRIFSLTNHAASLLFKKLGVYENFKSLAQFLFENTVKDLNIDSFIRYGIRLFYLYEIDLSFANLKDHLLGRLYKDDLFRAIEITPAPEDLAYVIVFKRANKKFRLTLGPLSREEIRNNFAEDSDLEVALLIDIDCYFENIPARETRPFLAESFHEISKMREQLDAYLQG